MKTILGADIFISLLLVFLVTTGLLFMNTDRPTEAGKKTASGEHELPPVKLQRLEGETAGSAKKEKSGITISACLKDNHIHYYLNNKPVSLSELKAYLLEHRPISVRIRFARNIPFGEYIKVIDICRRAGTKNIFNIYQFKQNN